MPDGASLGGRQFLRRYSSGRDTMLTVSLPPRPPPASCASPASREMLKPSGLMTGMTITRALTNRLVAGSASFGAVEYAQGVVGPGAPVTVQACRRDGQRLQGRRRPRERLARGPYRRLPDYQNELKKLVEENPGLVKPIQLPFKTYEGRTVEGIEITPNVNARDGKPIFLNMAVHHAREWPSAEHSMEWA